MLPYLTTQARLETETADSLIITSPPSKRWGVLFMIGILSLFTLLMALIGVWVWVENADAYLGLYAAGVLLLIVLFFMAVVTLGVQLAVDANLRTVTITKERLLGFGPWTRQRRQSLSFSQIKNITYNPQTDSWGRIDHYVKLETIAGKRIVLQFGSHQQEASQVVQIMTDWMREETNAAISEKPISDSLPKRTVGTSEMYALMLRSLRSWGVWLIILGGIHLFAAGFLNAPWGILLLVVGLASLYIQDATMFVIYAVTLTWVAIYNLTSAHIGWIALALFQFLWAFQTFRQFRRFYQTQKEQDTLTEQVPSTRASRIFPWTSAVLGGFSLIGYVVLVAIFIFRATSTGAATMAGAGFIEGLIIDMGVLGLATGLASILAGYEPKSLAITGMITGLLTLLIQLGFILIG